MSRAWLFPGQGTQRRGMGADYFDRYPTIEAVADEILGYSIRELCLLDPDRRLTSTLYCQPALYVVTSMNFLDRRRREPWPHWIAGHSLGEFCALFAASAFDFETGLRLVVHRAEIMSRHTSGSMLAVIGVPGAQLDGLIDELGQGTVDIATYNLPDQHVLSAPTEIINDISQRVVERPGARAVHMNIAGAAHSRYSTAAAAEFSEVLAEVEFRDPVVSTISNVTARPYEPGRVRETLQAQMRQPVRWLDTMTFLRREGVDHAQQVGPGRVLDGLWERSETLEAVS